MIYVNKKQLSLPGWILPEDNQKDIGTFYDREPELEKNCEMNKVQKEHKELNMGELGN